MEHKSLPITRTQEGFNQNAYKFFVKANYNPNEKNTLNKVLPEITSEKTHRLTSTQKY
mgnify:CR=1 FL=1